MEWGDYMRRTALGLAMALVMVMTACAPETGGGGSGSNGTTFKFRASKVTVVNHNDSFLYADDDEPYVLNLWFRVTYNKPNSAQVGIVGSRNNATPSLRDGQSHVLTGAQTAEVQFPNVKLLDVLDLFNANNQLEVVGTWTWAMEKDDVGVNGVADSALNIVKNLLNTVVASGSIPSDPMELVGAILGDFDDVFKLVAGALFASIPGIPDDAIGSRFYIGVPAKGTLSDIVDATAGPLPFPSIAIPIVSVPPDINGGKIFSLGHNSFFTGEVFDSGDGRHDYDIQIIDTATENQKPIAQFNANPGSSPSAPATVNFNASGSYDPDGTIVAYNWNFGDYQTGSGSNVNHTFTSAGVYPVILTVTDNRGDSTSYTYNYQVSGAPTVAPAGLTKVGSGCCDTYGDFSWNAVPGATAYEIRMDGFFGGGCVTDHGAVIQGQVTSGRVRAAGLCLGSKYDVSIRAQANGQWGPWSSNVRITL